MSQMRTSACGHGCSKPKGWLSSPKDVAEAGGWASTETFVRCYQQPDPETMLRDVLEGAELPEKKAA